MGDSGVPVHHGRGIAAGHLSIVQYALNPHEPVAAAAGCVRLRSGRKYRALGSTDTLRLLFFYGDAVAERSLRQLLRNVVLAIYFRNVSRTRQLCEAGAMPVCLLHLKKHL